MAQQQTVVSLTVGSLYNFYFRVCVRVRVCVIIQTIRQDRIRQTVLITKLHGFPLENVV